jgi:uncharacterized protein involved in outer membrane biogenesis
VQGTFQDQPYLLQVIGGPIEHLLRADQPWPVDAFASAVGAQLQLQGSIGDPASGSGIDLALELSGNRLGDLAPWLAMIDPEIDLVYNMSGQLKLTDEALELTLDNGQLGRTRFAGKLGWHPVETDPLLFAQLHFAVFDQREIELAFGLAPPATEPTPPMEILELPVLRLLGEWPEVTDADLALSADRVILEPNDITQVAITGRFRDGRMEHAPFRMTVGDTRLEGDLALNVQGDVPEAAFDLTAEQVNIGRLLSNLNVAKDVDASVERLRLLLRGRGVTLGQLLEQSDLSVTLDNGQWLLDNPDLPGKTRIQVRKGSIRSPIGEPITLALDGAIDRTPIKLELQGITMQQLIDPPERVKLSLKIDAAGNRFELDGAVALPIELSRLTLDLAAEGERLDTLENLLGVELPPLGPYRLQASLNMVKDSYSLRDMDFFVGSSHLYGSAELQITNQRPQFGINLSASTLQFDDFLGDSIFDAISGKTPRGNRQTSADLDKYWEDLFSREVMTSLDASINLKATQVLSGKDSLGNGEMALTLFNGKLAISPVRLKVPAGEINGRFTLSYDKTGLASEASVKVERFDYGILARRIDPKTDMGGRLTLDMTLSSLDPDLKNVLMRPSGHIHFAIWPAQFEAGVMDIWALNAFTALMATSPEEDVSQVNCIVGRFNVNTGIMDPELLVIDTTRVRAAGEGRIDLGNDTLDLVVVPRVKKSKILTLETPVMLRGGFQNFEVEVTSVDLLKTTARLAFELYHLPLAVLLRSGTGTIPADGFDLCDNPLQWSGDPLR